MPVPPPVPDPSHLEARLDLAATLLEEAVADVRKALAQLTGRDLLADADEEREVKCD